jgi:hypothetical protein
VHYEAGQTHAEPGTRGDVEWRERNLFFGGVSAVDAESLEAAGDPRRGGAP